MLHASQKSSSALSALFEKFYFFLNFRVTDDAFLHYFRTQDAASYMTTWYKQNVSIV